MLSVLFSTVSTIRKRVTLLFVLLKKKEKIKHVIKTGVSNLGTRKKHEFLKINIVLVSHRRRLNQFQSIQWNYWP